MKHATKSKQDFKDIRTCVHTNNTILCVPAENDAATAEDGADWLEDLVRQLNIPSLASFGVKREELHEVGIAYEGVLMQTSFLQLSQI